MRTSTRVAVIPPEERRKMPFTRLALLGSHHYKLFLYTYGIQVPSGVEGFKSVTGRIDFWGLGDCEFTIVADVDFEVFIAQNFRRNKELMKPLFFFFMLDFPTSRADRDV